MIEAWFDGVTEPVNPGGHAAYGVLITVDGAVAVGEGVYVGVGAQMSNNVAEYAGMVRVLEFIEAKPGERAVVCGDSKLVIMQLLGQWKAKGGLYMPWYLKAREVYQRVKERVELKWVPREENEACDDFSKRVLRDRGVKFRIQAEG